jgi:membrane protease YdiL (CAAX protease family)
VAFCLGGWLTFSLLMAVHHVPSSVSSAELSKQGYWRAAVLLGAFPCELAVIWFATRLASRPFSEYLALNWPERNELLLALLVMFVVMCGLSGTADVFGQTADAGVVAEYLSVRDNGYLFFFLVVVCIGAPIFEEFTVRGFLFRGWSESFLGPGGAIILTSMLWASYHIQYN